jgi:hypothetical protein
MVARRPRRSEASKRTRAAARRQRASKGGGSADGSGPGIGGSGPRLIRKPTGGSGGNRSGVDSQANWSARFELATSPLQEFACVVRPIFGRCPAVLRTKCHDGPMPAAVMLNLSLPASREPRRNLRPRIAARNQWARIGAEPGRSAHRDSVHLPGPDLPRTHHGDSKRLGSLARAVGVEAEAVPGQRARTLLCPTECRVGTGGGCVGFSRPAAR